MNRTLLGLFSDRAQAEAAAQQLRAAGLQPERIDQAEQAERVAEEAHAGQPGAGTGAAGPGTAGAGTGAALGALAGGVVGAVPGALLGGLLGHGLTEHTAHWYAREVAAGGVVLVVEAPEIAPAAEAETILRAAGAAHVHTGEVPRT